MTVTLISKSSTILLFVTHLYFFLFRLFYNYYLKGEVFIFLFGKLNDCFSFNIFSFRVVPYFEKYPKILCC